MAPGDATWRVGTVLSIASGTQAVTGLGGTPKAVFFWGTNWKTEDVAVTTTGTGLFRGMAAPLFSSPSTIIQDSLSVTPAGDASAQQPHAITMMNTSGAIAFEYAADLASFDADGFTLSWLAGSVTGHKIVYAALMDVTDCLGYKGAGTTAALGFKAGASLIHGNWQWATTGFAAADRTQMWFGGGAYPSVGPTGWFGAGLSALTFPGSASAQYDIGIFDQAPGVAIANGGQFIGPFLVTANVTAFPTGGGLTDFAFNPTGANGGMLVAWSDEASETGRLTPAALPGDTVTVSGLPFPPGLVTGYSISDEPQGQGTGGRGAVGFSVITPDFQWTALVDGVSSRGSYQSFQRGVCDMVSGTDIHTGSIELTGDGFVVTTEEDTASPAQSWVWHAFGHPQRQFRWIPHIYRRVYG